MKHSRVHALRAMVLGVIRVVALILIVVGLIMIGNRVLFGWWGAGDITQGWNIWMSNGQRHGIFLGVPLMSAGVLLAFLSAWLSAWIVRAPGIGCARCGYETLDEDGRCSECGYR